jgi:hypothetical protein
MKDLPARLAYRALTIDVEAKAKEQAVVALRDAWPGDERPRSRRRHRARVGEPRARKAI